LGAFENHAQGLLPPSIYENSLINGHTKKLPFRDDGYLLLSVVAKQ